MNTSIPLATLICSIVQLLYFIHTRTSNSCLLWLTQAAINKMKLFSNTLLWTHCSVDTLNIPVGSLLKYISYSNTQKLKVSIAGVWGLLLRSRASGAVYTRFPAFNVWFLLIKLKEPKLDNLGSHWLRSSGLRRTLALLISRWSVGDGVVLRR